MKFCDILLDFVFTKQNQGNDRSTFLCEVDMGDEGVPAWSESLKILQKHLCQLLGNYRPCRCDALQDHDYYSAWGKLLLHQRFVFVAF